MNRHGATTATATASTVKEIRISSSATRAPCQWNKDDVAMGVTAVGCSCFITTVFAIATATTALTLLRSGTTAIATNGRACIAIVAPRATLSEWMTCAAPCIFVRTCGFTTGNATQRFRAARVGIVAWNIFARTETRLLPSIAKGTVHAAGSATGVTGAAFGTTSCSERVFVFSCTTTATWTTICATCTHTDIYGANSTDGTRREQRKRQVCLIAGSARIRIAQRRSVGFAARKNQRVDDHSAATRALS